MNPKLEIVARIYLTERGGRVESATRRGMVRGTRWVELQHTNPIFGARDFVEATQTYVSFYVTNYDTDETLRGSQVLVYADDSWVMTGAVVGVAT